MKRNYIVKLFALLFLIIGIASCRSNENNKTAFHQHPENFDQYTCPMHPQVLQNPPGSCPVCGMDLVLKKEAAAHTGIDTTLNYLLKPVNEQVVASLPTIKASFGTRVHTEKVQGRIIYDTRNQTSIASRVSGRIERLYIKYNYQRVKKGQLIMEVYSPDLATAQKELLYISSTGNVESMMEGAKQRLLLLGMTGKQITNVLRTGRISYSVPVYSNADGYILEQAANAASTPPSAFGSGNASSSGAMGEMISGSSASPVSSSIRAAPATPVLIREGQYVSAGQGIFTIYKTEGLVAEFSLTPQMASSLKRQQKLIISRVSDPDISFAGEIRLIQPVLNAGENFTVARVYLSNKNLRPGELVAAHFPVVTDQSLWLPQEALVGMGNRWVVFKKEGKVFVPREIKTGVSTKKEVQVKTDISAWEIARNAYFLVDSESFIKYN